VRRARAPVDEGGTRSNTRSIFCRAITAGDRGDPGRTRTNQPTNRPPPRGPRPRLLLLRRRLPPRRGSHAGRPRFPREATRIRRCGCEGWDAGCDPADPDGRFCPLPLPSSTPPSIHPCLYSPFAFSTASSLDSAGDLHILLLHKMLFSWCTETIVSLPGEKKEAAAEKNVRSPIARATSCGSCKDQIWTDPKEE
jgi:hypothetical protein